MTLTTWFLLLLAIAMEIAREICFKLAANRSEAKQQSHYLLKLFGTPLIWLGFVCWAVELVSWIMVLAHMPLSVAFPMMSICYCGMIVASKYILRETIGWNKWLGVMLITMGVAIIGSQGIG